MFHIILRPFGLLFVAVSLSACGGGGGGNTTANFADLGARAQALDSEFRDLSFTNPGTLPNSGSASYNGVLGYGAGDAAVVGEMRLDANFGSNTISGNVGNFVDSENGRYGGSLSISDGQIDRSADTSVEYTFLADIGGTLSQNGDNYVVNGNMRGDFLGDDYRGVEGDTVVSVIGPGVNGIVEGGFIGKR